MYKIWIGKFVHLVSQIRPGARSPLEEVLRAAYRGDPLDSVTDLNSDLNENVYSTLFDKTEGEGTT